MDYATRNPYTGEQVASFAEATDAEVAGAIARAHAAFLEWRHSSFGQRAAVLRRAAALLRERHRHYALLPTLEMGKLLRESEVEVEVAACIFEYYADNAERLLAPQPLPVPGRRDGEALLLHEPLGVILAIEPWNFPYYQIARILAPQLAAGNTLLLKHAPSVPQCAAAFEALLHEAGLPQGAFINLRASHAQVGTILDDPRVCGVALTGSERAGAAVAARAGQALKKSTLELGGSDAFVVLDDADLEATVRWAVIGRHWNAGQVCVASKRMIVVDALYDAFLARYAEAVAALVAGDPLDPANTLAPLSSRAAVDRLHRQVEAAVAHGAIATGIGPRIPMQGAFAQPTLLTGVAADNPAYHCEFFGPVSMVFRARDEDDAVRIANDSPYGLGGSVFTCDVARGAALARRISSGMVYVNRPAFGMPGLPFGGIRRSGYGRELAGLGIKEFVNHKVIDLNGLDLPS